MFVGNRCRGRGWVCAGLIVVTAFLAPAFSPVQAVRAAGLSVTNCDATGTGSLTAAINLANTNADTNNTITFAQDCITTVITFTSVQTISKTITIDGTGHQVTISGGDTVGLFAVNDSGVTFAVIGLTLTGGNLDGGLGGAISNLSSGTVTVTNSTFSGNSTPDGSGGAISNLSSGTVTVTNSTFSGNSTPDGFGGAISNLSSGTVTVTNSTFSGNSSPDGSGGAISNLSSGTVTVTNSTLSGNSASSGGGINNNFGTLNVANTLIVNNPGGDVTGNGINGTNTKNLTGSFTFATPLQNNGGPTATFALPPGSPALGGGDLATCTNRSCERQGSARWYPP